VKDNKSNDIKIGQRITEATSGLNNHYFTMVAERMSASNADLLSQFIIQNRQNSIIANNTIEMYIDGIVYLENYHKHKDLDKMDRNDIMIFLDSYRKPETIDPLHKWINTYNIRHMVILKFFRWLYSSKSGGSEIMIITEKIVPPIMNGIKRLKKEKKRAHIKPEIYGHKKMTDLSKVL
jgi:hypothetical protein